MMPRPTKVTVGGLPFSLRSDAVTLTSSVALFAVEGSGRSFGWRGTSGGSVRMQFLVVDSVHRVGRDNV
jgi:hypothetical protein